MCLCESRFPDTNIYYPLFFGMSLRLFTINCPLRDQQFLINFMKCSFRRKLLPGQRHICVHSSVLIKSLVRSLLTFVASHAHLFLLQLSVGKL